MSRYERSSGPPPDPRDSGGAPRRAPGDLLTNLEEIDLAARPAPSDLAAAFKPPETAVEYDVPEIAAEHDAPELAIDADAPATSVRYRIPLPPPRTLSTPADPEPWSAPPGTEAGATPPAETSGRTPRPPRTYAIDAPTHSVGIDGPGGFHDAGRSAAMPYEVSMLRWNWGAFALPPMWCAAHGVPTIGYAYALLGVLLLLSPFVFGPTYGAPVFFLSAFAMLSIGVYLGARGNEIAWRNRTFDNGAQGFFDVQRGWMLSAVAIALPIYTFLFATFGFQVLRASRDRQEAVSGLTPSSSNTPSAAPPMLPPSSRPSQSIIYTGPAADYNRDHYLHPENQPSASSTSGAGVPGALPTPGSPAAADPRTEPGALPAAPETQAAPDTEQPISLPATGQYTPSAPPPDQGAAPTDQSPQAAPNPEAPAPDAAPLPDQTSTNYPGLPPGQQ